ncbi:MAG: hypothetical protein AB7T49_09265 [Oligoflexales bacterium]
MRRKAMFQTILGIGMTMSAVGFGQSFLPPNNLHLQDSLFASAGLTEDQFEAVLSKVEGAYQPIYGSHGVQLQVNKLWTDTTVNASAQKSGKSWIINMYGGLARREEVTVDGFTLVACHEMGHHLGGWPQTLLGRMSVEGESDYFATQACAKVLWKEELQENAVYRDTVPAAGKTVCDAKYQGEDDQNLCYRIVVAGISLGNLLSHLGGGGDVAVDTPSTDQARRTQRTHPKAQCRLDTYVAGALCLKAFDDYKIPGNWEEARSTSCARADGDTVGARPACWFKEPR